MARPLVGKKGAAMRQRYVLIEPKYGDPDTFCHFAIGSDRVRASIQIYADLEMLLDVAEGLDAPNLKEERLPWEYGDFDPSHANFDLLVSVLPHDGGTRTVRFRVFQDIQEDGAPYRADIRFHLSEPEAKAFAAELRAWCAKPKFTFVWKGD